MSRVSRPNSLQLEGPQPEKEPLRFEVQLVGAPPEVEQLVNNIKHVAEDFLYHWRTFPIVLPPTRFSGPGARLSDIILAPPCEDIDTTALEGGLEPQPLSSKQLHSIKEKGEFEVPSRHFPGHSQVWQVAGWLQRGRVRAKEDLYGYLANAAALLIVVARDRLVRDKAFSVVAGFKELLGGLHRLLDLFIGMPYLEARDLEKRVRDERSRYLIAELICKPEYEADLIALASWIEKAMPKVKAGEPIARRPPPVPLLYTTPSGIDIDLSLHRRETLKALSGPMQRVIEREARGWFLSFRERIAASHSHLPPSDMQQEIKEAGMREYIRRICNAITTCEELQHFQHLHHLLTRQLHCAHALERAEDEVRRKLEAGLATAEARIDVSHPILSRSPAWKREKLKQAGDRLREGLRWAALEQASSSLPWPQAKYFLQRDLTFLRSREPLLVKELLNATSPSREFKWRARVWLPRNSQTNCLYVTKTTDTRLPGWRVNNFVHRSWSWCWRVLYFLVVGVCWNSPVSLRALTSVTPYRIHYDVTQHWPWLQKLVNNKTNTNGGYTECHSMWSRCLAIWRHSARQRTRFETQPDTGLLGKGLSRWCNRAWYCGAVGGLCTVALLLLFPLFAVLCLLIAGIAAILCPIGVPIAALLAHIASALVWEIDNVIPTDRWFALARTIVWRVTVLGVLQPVAAAVVALLFCPITAFAILLGGATWCAVRSVWERVVWRLLIAQKARVPVMDSAFCTRRRPPPARAPYLLSAPQAYAAIIARAETEILTLWSHNAEAAIDKPVKDYRHFVEACFGPFSVQIAKTGAYKQLEKECAELTATLKEKVSSRRAELALSLSDNVRGRVRMTVADLKRAVCVSGAELSRLAIPLGIPPSIPTLNTGPATSNNPSLRTSIGDNGTNTSRNSTGDGSGTSRSTGDGTLRNSTGVNGTQRNSTGENGTVRNSTGLNGTQRNSVDHGTGEIGTVRNGTGMNDVGRVKTLRCGGGIDDEVNSEEWWDSRGLRVGDWPALAASFLADMFEASILRGIDESEPRAPLESGAGVRNWALPQPPDSSVNLCFKGSLVGKLWVESGWWAGLSCGLPPTVPLPAPTWSPRAPHPHLAAPPHIAAHIYNRDAENPLPLESEVCAEILKLLDEGYFNDRKEPHRYREDSEDVSLATSDDGTYDFDDGDEPPRCDDRPPTEVDNTIELRRSSVNKTACQWTLSGRGVRVQVELASPEDSIVDESRHHTSV